MSDTNYSHDLLIVGCGEVGGRVAKAALARGWRVSALTRNAQKGSALEAEGISVLIGDLAEADWHGALEPHRYVVNAVSAGGGGLAGYQRSYVAGQHSLLRCLAAWPCPPQALVYTSSVGVYPQDDGGLVDEEAPCGGEGRRGLLCEAERLLLEQGARMRVVVLRLAGLYGPGRHLLLESVRGGEPLSGDGERYLNLLHLEDAARAVLQSLDQPAARGAYNVSDGRPSRRAEIVQWLAERLQLCNPGFGGEAGRRGPMPNRRIDSRRFFEQLGFQPAYPSYQAGYEAILAAETQSSQD